MANTRQCVHPLMVLNETTYLITRSINHGGLSQNTSIWFVDSVFSSAGPSSCMHFYSTMTRSPASHFSSSSQSSPCYSFVLHFFFVIHGFADPICWQLGMAPSVSICPPCICDHRCRTLVVARLYTLPLFLPLHHMLVLREWNDTLERSLSNIWQNRVFQSFPSWI